MAAVTLLGRGAELLTFTRALDAAVEGRTTALLVAGEAGIGKTRLLEEFERLAGSRAIPVLWGRAADDEGAPAFWPWRQVLRSWLTTTDHEDAEALVGDAYVDFTRIAPELAAVCAAGARVEPAALDAEDRFALFETVAGFLGQAAAPRALVVLLDDLHWSDTASLLLLAHVARYLRESRLLLVAAFRPVEITHTPRGSDVVAGLTAQPWAGRIDLAGLSVEDIGEQLAMVMGRPASEETVATVARRTAGNPLFVQEVGRLLAEGADGVPAGVRAAIGRRLTYLPTSERAGLACAAVVSSVIDPGLLSVVTDVDIALVMEALEAALPLGLVGRASGAVGFRFVHDLVRECCALDASASEQRRIHLAVAVHLERTDPGQHLAEIAHHRMAALPLGDPNPARDAGARAAVHALELLAYEDAARLYRWALDAAARAGADPEQRARLLVDAARAHHLANDGGASKSICEEAAALAQQAGDAEALARAALVREDTTDPGLAGQGRRLVPRRARRPGRRRQPAAGAGARPAGDGPPVPQRAVTDRTGERRSTRHGRADRRPRGLGNRLPRPAAGAVLGRRCRGAAGARRPHGGARRTDR